MIYYSAELGQLIGAEIVHYEIQVHVSAFNAACGDSFAAPVHSSHFVQFHPDFIIPVEIAGSTVDVYVLKRPWLDHFMASVGERFEVVVFTASLAKYADALLDLLDTKNVVRWRLFREACALRKGNYVKDLSILGRDLAATIIVDNSPHSYIFQPRNAMPIGTFIDDLEDHALLDMLPLLAQVRLVCIPARSDRKQNGSSRLDFGTSPEF